MQQAAAEHLPFESDAFDAALAQLVVHFMADPVAGLREMARVTRERGVVAACVWDHAGGQGPLSVFWEAAHELDPHVEDESQLAGAREGHLEELFQAAGLQDVEGTALAVRVEHPTFEDWWEPFTLGVGPAGSYAAGLDPEAQARLRERCRELLPTAPFVLTPRAWASRGLVELLAGGVLQQLLHAVDFDLLVGLDVPGEGARVRLDAASGGVELLHHRQRALVVADHEAEEKAVEGRAARRGEPLHVRVGEHPGHQHPAGAVCVPVHAVPDGRLLAPGLEPRRHLLDLGLLRDVDALRQELDVALRAALRHERRHVERLGVVVDHPLHEGDVRLRVRRQLELVELVRRQRLRRLSGGAGLDDVRRGLAHGLRLVGAAAARERNARPSPRGTLRV